MFIFFYLDVSDFFWRGSISARWSFSKVSKSCILNNSCLSSQELVPCKRKKMILLQGQKKYCTEEKCAQLESQLDTSSAQPPPDSAADDIIVWSYWCNFSYIAREGEKEVWTRKHVVESHADTI